MREFHVYFVPRKTSLCVNIFENGGVLGDIVLGELPLLFLPLEQDLISLELDTCFQELYLVLRHFYFADLGWGSLEHYLLCTGSYASAERIWPFPSVDG
jgi:hypothetical protein